MWLRVGVLAVGGTLLAGCFLPPPAVAGTATLELVRRPAGFAAELTYRAGAGERNDVTVSSGADFVRVEDRTGVTSGPGCESAAPTVAVCPAEDGRASLRMSLRDRDDRARVAASWNRDVAIHGGPGDDRLRSAGTSHNRFAGGRGDDVMSGGGFSTLFDEGPDRNGSDAMTATPQPALEGGLVPPQYVWVDYGDRREPVLADLRGGRNDGEAAEGDRLGRGVNGIRAGWASDRIIGDAGDNALVGGAGADLLFGGGGDDRMVATVLRRNVLAPGGFVRGTTDDRLWGGSGRDLLEASAGPNWLEGGPGPDQIWAAGGADSIRDRDGYVDEIHCGLGRDRVQNDAIDFAQGCERSVSRRGAAFPLVLEGARIPCKYGPPCGHPWVAVVEVACPKPRKGGCRGSVRIELGGQPAGEGFFAVEAGFSGATAEIETSEETLELIERRDARVLVIVTSSGGQVIRAPLSRIATEWLFLPSVPHRLG